MHKPDVLFVLTIDTEEEWLWDEEFPQDNCSIQNIGRIPDFHKACVELGIRPTYFVDYAVANDLNASAILKQFHQANEAEIGAHLHPWCNPPYFGKTTEPESHVINLPHEQVEQKLDKLTEIICENIDVVPQSFRSGRWGISGKTLQLLASRGYKVDSSVYPYYKNEFFTCEGAPSFPYWPTETNALKPGKQRQIMEIPVSAGFNIANFNLGEKVHNAFSTPSIAWTKLIGVLWHTQLLRKIYLSPELTCADNMNALIDKCLQNKHPVIHMYLHSSSLIDGATGLLNVQNAIESIVDRIKMSVSHLHNKANVQFCTISEAAYLLKQQQSTDIIRYREAG